MPRPRILFVCRQGNESSMRAEEMRAWLRGTNREKDFRVDFLPKGMDDNKDTIEIENHFSNSDLVVHLDRGSSLRNEVLRFVRDVKGIPPEVHELGYSEGREEIEKWGGRILEKAQNAWRKRWGQ